MMSTAWNGAVVMVTVYWDGANGKHHTFEVQIEHIIKLGGPIQFLLLAVLQ